MEVPGATTAQSGQTDQLLSFPQTRVTVVELLKQNGGLKAVTFFCPCANEMRKPPSGTWSELLCVLTKWHLNTEPFLSPFQVSKEMITFYDSIYNDALKTDLTGDNDKKAATASVLKVFHETVRRHALNKYNVLISDHINRCNIL